HGAATDRHPHSCVTVLHIPELVQPRRDLNRGRHDHRTGCGEPGQPGSEVQPMGELVPGGAYLRPDDDHSLTSRSQTVGGTLCSPGPAGTGCSTRGGNGSASAPASARVTTRRAQLWVTRAEST